MELTPLFGAVAAVGLAAPNLGSSDDSPCPPGASAPERQETAVLHPLTEHPGAHIVVGVVHGQPDGVLASAADFAERFDAELVCASVDPSRYASERRPDGTVVALPIDPDLADDVVEEFDPALRASIAVLDARPVQWSARALAGGPAQELARLADELSASMIVVGTRETGFRESVREFFGGSVAVQLAHRQHRPVVVVPLNPVGVDGTLPWQDGA